MLESTSGVQFFQPFRMWRLAPQSKCWAWYRSLGSRYGTELLQYGSCRVEHGILESHPLVAAPHTLPLFAAASYSISALMGRCW
jgi:hypothetical protein